MQYQKVFNKYLMLIKCMEAKNKISMKNNKLVKLKLVF